MLLWLLQGDAQIRVSAMETLTADATAVGVVIAALSLVGLAVQTFLANRASAVSTALSTHGDYLKLCIERPEFSSSTGGAEASETEGFLGPP
jgi:hypothetical protein